MEPGLKDLPITESVPTPTNTLSNDSLSDQDDTVATQEQEEVFLVQIDRLAQVIATHLQFDHLDAVISSTDKEIATEFQHHIQINVEPNNEAYKESMLHNQQQEEEELPTLDMMDLEILKSQIFAAIQAHTEGSLPLTWDKLAEKLTRQSIESYLRKSVAQTCANDQQDTVLSSCLSDNAIPLANDLDQYIMEGLAQVFKLLDKQALPDLLQHTANDLKGILNYFNSAFLQDGNRKFVLQVIPWNNDPTDIHGFESKLLDMAVHPSYGETSHSTAFFIEYATMARV
ncbi:uncharacterized protein B0P05DRAFT_633455 [Gilbertella persicaria]|uniref:uncharacterized protein n=1 Tax=Gilbertella persicaria TaxID=101096 RepID=UPI00221FB627|nr:uncharacterized protein B0P05DRAFT_633455 [Gilbertella persicaria]KAI8098405.1 hypothetical protein B0P05DRAFT_633455 [Gilbertella persicaria]